MGGGIESGRSYPYTARNGNCQFSRSRVVATVSSYKMVGRGSESTMKSYVGSTGPLSVCVDANSWNSYRGGVMTSCGNSVDHCVQVVGYGSSGSTNYWKVRNSWGRNWGEGGHVRVAIGRNLCDINSEPTAVTAQGSGPSPSPSPSPSPTPSCVDTDSASDCSYWVSEGYCSSSSQYYSYMKQHCCHSCHFMDESFRRSVFEARMLEAEALQKQNPLAEFGATKFSDWTQEEMKASLTNYVPANTTTIPDMDTSHL